MFGDTVFAVTAVLALGYALFNLFWYVLFYPETDETGKKRYTHRSDDSFMAYLPNKRLRLRNHESNKIKSLPYFEYTEVE